MPLTLADVTVDPPVPIPVMTHRASPFGPALIVAIDTERQIVIIDCPGYGLGAECSAGFLGAAFVEMAP